MKTALLAARTTGEVQIQMVFISICDDAAALALTPFTFYLWNCLNLERVRTHKHTHATNTAHMWLGGLTLAFTEP